MPKTQEEKIQAELQKHFNNQFGKITHINGVHTKHMEQATSNYRSHLFTDCEFTIEAGFRPSRAVGFYISELPNYDDELIIHKQ